MKNRINPVGLKGNEINDRMKQLMGITESKKVNDRSSIEISKMGPDGNVYGIVREGHEYFIKTTSKKSNILAEDFKYIGGLQNKRDFAYPSYEKAIKHLNLKFISLNEAKGGNADINIFVDDKLHEDVAGYYDASGSGFKNEGNMEHNDKSTCCHAPISEGTCSKCGKTTVQEAEDVDLTETEQAVEDMAKDPAEKIPVQEKRLSIARAINDMSNIIDNLLKEEPKKKVYTLK